MENQHFLDSNQLQTQNERPTFLTVLCILTFVVSGLMLISYTFGTITYSVEKQQLANEMEITQTIKIAEMFSGGEEVDVDDQVAMMELRHQEEFDNHTVLTLINFLSVMLSLIGAFLMYNLRKLGFHLYTLSKVIALIPMAILTLTSAVAWAMIIGALISIIFIIMYSRNLKYMK